VTDKKWFADVYNITWLLTFLAFLQDHLLLTKPAAQTAVPSLSPKFSSPTKGKNGFLSSRQSENEGINQVIVFVSRHFNKF